MADETPTLTGIAKGFEEVKSDLEAKEAEIARLRAVIEREAQVQDQIAEENSDEFVITLADESAARLREALK